MAVPQRNSISPEKVPSDLGREAGPGTAFRRAGDHDEFLVLSTLKNLVAAGEHRLDPILAAIADAAQLLTGASGVALAMWKDGAMVCRARSGETAPVLGARLNADTGISGECMRTGKSQHCPDTEDNPLVDVEVCRALGLRSIAVLPIQGWRGINGILEAFSTAPAAFTEHHLAVLEQLAALAERVRATQPHDASPLVAKLSIEEPEPKGLLPASDRVSDVALALVDRRSRPLVLGALGLAGISLLGFAVWLGWHGRGENDGKGYAAAPSSAAAAAIAPLAENHAADMHPPPRPRPDNDPVWKPNPGGQPLLPSGSKPSAGLVKFAPKAGVIEGKKTKGDRPLLTADAAGFALPQRTPGSDTGADNNPSGASPAETAVPVVPPPIPAGESNSSALNSVLSAKPALPGLSTPVSQGVSGGKLLHRVPPVYPAQARMLRLEGRVILDATVMEDGSLRDLKVVQGEPVLAQSAMEAVKHWRYQPFVLDGKPVKTETRISVDFKLPRDR